MADVHLRR